VQAAVEALVALLEQGLVADEVEALDAHLAPEGALVVDNRLMPNVNAQYLLTGTLLDRRFSIEMAHDEARLAAPETRAVMARVHLVPDAALAGTRGCRLLVRRRDGSVLEETVGAVRGTPDDPMSFAEVATKSEDLFSSLLGERGKAVVDLVANVEELADLAPLAQAMRPE
jgi:2-methylcitrate dehydratase PrpD